MDFTRGLTFLSDCHYLGAIRGKNQPGFLAQRLAMVS